MKIPRITYADGRDVVRESEADVYIGRPADKDGRLVLVLDGVRYDLTDLAPKLGQEIERLPAVHADIARREAPHPPDAILRIKRVRDSFGLAEPGNVAPGRPGLKETKDAMEACGWDEAACRARLIELGHAREVTRV